MERRVKIAVGFLLFDAVIVALVVVFFLIFAFAPGLIPEPIRRAIVKAMTDTPGALIS
jgi:hypothetical protein